MRAFRNSNFEQFKFLKVEKNKSVTNRRDCLNQMENTSKGPGFLGNFGGEFRTKKVYDSGLFQGSIEIKLEMTSHQAL